MGVLDQYTRGFLMRKLGPDWEQKQALLQAQTANTQADAAHTQAQIPLVEAQAAGVRGANDLNAQKMEWMKANRAEIEALVRTGKLPSSDLEAVDRLLAMQEMPLKRELTRSQIDENKAQAYRAMHPVAPQQPNENAGVWITGPDGRPAMLGRGGIFNQVGGQQIGPPMTADERNSERYSATLPTQLDMLQDALNEVNKINGMNRAASLVPNTDAYNTVQVYTSLVNEIAQTLGKSLGEQRLTDQDRAVYAQALGTVNKLKLAGGGGPGAQKLLDTTRRLVSSIQAAKVNTRIPGAPDNYPPASDVPGGGYNPPPNPPGYIEGDVNNAEQNETAARNAIPGQTSVRKTLPDGRVMEQVAPGKWRLVQ